MGNSNTSDSLGSGIHLRIYFHLQIVLDKWYDLSTGNDKWSNSRKSFLYQNDNALVENYKLNTDLLNWTLEEIDLASRSVQYDLRRKMNFFSLAFSK